MENGNQFFLAMISVKKVVRFAFLFILFISFLIFPSSLRADELQRIVIKSSERNLIDRFKLHRGISVREVEKIEELNITVVEVPSSGAGTLSEKLASESYVKYVEPDFIASIDASVSDPSILENLQWAFTKIEVYGVRSAWDISQGSENVLTAIIDTGIDSGHEDLAGKVVKSRNCTDSPTSEDVQGHGTHVAGIVAANTDNNVGVAGIGYKTRLLNAKALGDSGSGYYSWIADCIVWAADSGAHVLNMSLGGSSSSQMLADAISYARARGVIVVAAAGNSGTNSPSYPAYYPEVVSVGAVDQNDVKPSWSNWGSWVDVAAPGVSIYSTLPHYPNSMSKILYGSLSGTSMATPFVSGLAALGRSMPNTSAHLVEQALFESADKIGGTGSSWVWGRINAYKTLSSLAGNLPVSPTPTLIPTKTLTPTPTITPTRIPTSTPAPTLTLTPAITPISISLTPTPKSKNPWSRLCSRFPYLCK